MVTYKPTGVVVFAGLSVITCEDWQFWLCINKDFTDNVHINGMERAFAARQFNITYYSNYFHLVTAKATGKEKPLDFFETTLQNFNYLLPFIRRNGSL